MNTSDQRLTASRYLESQVATASQPQLQILLLDGAVRACQRAIDLWHEERGCSGAEPHLAKATDIAAALAQSAADGQTSLSKRFEEEYAFLFRELVVVRLNKDASKLGRVIELLQFQRETWRQACEHLQSDANLSASSASEAPPRRALSPANRTAGRHDAVLENRLSIEA